MTPDIVLPAIARKIVYVLFAVAGVVLGALPVGFNAAGLELPTWANVATDVFAFVVAAPFVIAIMNMNGAVVDDGASVGDIEE